MSKTIQNSVYYDHHTDVTMYVDELDRLVWWHYGEPDDEPSHVTLDDEYSEENWKGDGMIDWLKDHQKRGGVDCFVERMTLDSSGRIPLEAFVVDVEPKDKDDNGLPWPRFVFVKSRSMGDTVTPPVPDALRPALAAVEGEEKPWAEELLACAH